MIKAAMTTRAPRADRSFAMPAMGSSREQKQAEVSQRELHHFRETSSSRSSNIYSIIELQDWKVLREEEEDSAKPKNSDD
jgi:hypothetical protein